MVLSIVGGVNEQIALWINVNADDWTTETAIIASNEIEVSLDSVQSGR